MICPPELFARREILTTSLNTSISGQSNIPIQNVLEVIHIILPAMLCLMLVLLRRMLTWFWFGNLGNGLAGQSGSGDAHLASKPAVLQVNLRHWTSSPSSDIGP